MSHDSTEHTAYNLFLSVALGILAEWASFVKGNNEIVNSIGVLFQWFAWGGAGCIGVVTLVKFAHEMLFKQKPKRKIK